MKTVTFDEDKFMLVPIEPTPAMIVAGNRGLANDIECDLAPIVEEAASANCWRRMLWASEPDPE